MQSIRLTSRLQLIDAFRGAHVRVTVLSNILRLRCDLCVRAGSCSHAAYEVLGVRVCRKHIAKIIDSATKTLRATDRRVHVDAVITTLSPVRKNHGRALKHDMLRALDKIGILEIPDPIVDRNH